MWWVTRDRRGRGPQRRSGYRGMARDLCFACSMHFSWGTYTVLRLCSILFYHIPFRSIMFCSVLLCHVMSCHVVRCLIDRKCGRDPAAVWPDNSSFLGIRQRRGAPTRPELLNGNGPLLALDYTSIGRREKARVGTFSRARTDSFTVRPRYVTWRLAGAVGR